MNTTWSLDALYTGYDDENFKEDMKQFDLMSVKMDNLSKELDNLPEKQALNQIFDCLEEAFRLEHLAAYCSLRQSTNTQETEATSYLGQINQKSSNLAKANTIFMKYIAKIDDIDALIKEDERLSEYAYFIRKIKENNKHLLSDETEEIIAKMSISGANAWSELQSYLTSTVKALYDGEEVTLSEIRNMAYSTDKSTRKRAYEAELECYNKIKDSVAYSLNSIKLQVLTLSKLRGYSSVLDMTLDQSHMQKETLNAMITAMKEYMPKFHEYLRAKGKALGHENGLPWYDLFAPMGASEKKYSIEEAKEYLLTHFRTFAPDLAQMVERAFDESWIDFYPKAGKVGGAFCANLQPIKQSRILSNYDGTISDIVTLAHELGHAYHNHNIHDHRLLNSDYSMPVAETASTFNENVILNAAIKDAKGEERLALIEGQLQDATQIICDIYSRYLFETAVIEKRNDNFMFADELCEMMLAAQKEAYGDGLDSESLHPYMWVCKGHYYSGSNSFYNFPYAFGGLFARGLYAKYMEEGEAFLPKYRALLHATTVSDVEDAAKIAGIDLTDPDFFRKALQTFSDQIDEFKKLV
ncbi:M3 family oligoendopeptidase [Lachnoclostridium phytofermentans]|uniref:Oligoendopeptidase, pepF/M3 family n=1 Tax=Lachnoclostridium phytofermentans (strain ATCC 700394 / DSM 18823 / ISDg) TaxID=357809 RepID=A9KSK0_LACP7|nr:M3 family oligoendopeptidase [Lachnoclostridium phytofermentans]ABX43652.1 oligoendopeptidase, pepF/M3 family [Lachnoclostridium phytofermentans ISDg]